MTSGARSPLELSRAGCPVPGARYEEAYSAVRRSADAALHRVLEWQSGRAGRARCRRARGAGDRDGAAACGLAPEGPWWLSR